MRLDREYPALDDTPRSHLPFSPCVKAGPFVFVSGQASVDAGGRIVSDSFEGEMRRSMESMRAILKAAGCDFADVVQTRSYVDDPADLPDFNRLYRDYFSAPYPARTTLTGCLGGSLRYEIDAIAVVGAARAGEGEAA